MGNSDLSTFQPKGLYQRQDAQTQTKNTKTEQQGT